MRLYAGPAKQFVSDTVRNQVADKLKDAFVRAIAFRRLGKPQEIADAIVFFAGQKSSYVTAQVLSVSGGLTFAG